jgi:hypothetical protein
MWQSTNPRYVIILGSKFPSQNLGCTALLR